MGDNTGNSLNGGRFTMDIHVLCLTRGVPEAKLIDELGIGDKKTGNNFDTLYIGH
jgi:hypothetical protein